MQLHNFHAIDKTIAEDVNVMDGGIADEVALKIANDHMNPDFGSACVVDVNLDGL